MSNKLSSYSYHSSNPFMNETLHHIDKGEKTVLLSNKTPDMIIDSDGNVKGHSVFIKKVKVDKAKFTKMYMTSLSSWFGLSKAGMKMFGFIATTVGINKDNLYIDFESAMEFTGYKSKKTIFSALGELLNNKFIARGKNMYHYYINPTIFFNGNRLTFLEQYTISEDDTTKEID